ncbi:MAG TPA: 2,3-bisphosphoglycerate-independent phosphoglycerate mutase [bacterium (Candidatus Stahlbacteria)]|nr:2,3-bisphosphoglycerate-independent phosphoglycerate mutase [Candidatus Stahlbacteria bacterium]
MIDDLVIKSDHKICLLVIDGLGDIPSGDQTPLERAKTPNLDALAPSSAMGLLYPVAPGITPGSGPGHLALFGYDPLKNQIGRGLLEALGVGIEVGPDDLCLRANFATLKDNVVVDRRAGRISTDENIRLCRRLSQIKEIEDVTVRIKSGKEHRFVVVFNGKRLSADVADADPQKSGKEMVLAKAILPDAEKTARIINSYISLADEVLGDEERANHILLRGAASYPDLRTMEERYKLKCLALASYPMYLGIARLLGMVAINPGPDYRTLFETYVKEKEKYDFVYIHIKETDKAGEDGNFEEKTRVIEKIDSSLKVLIEDQPAVLAITADHSTPTKLRSHSWHPCPLLIKSTYSPQDRLPRFTEKNCTSGSIGHIRGIDLFPLLLANSLRLKKYGA